MYKIIVDLGCGMNPRKDATVVVDSNPKIKELESRYEKIIYDLNNIPYPFDEQSVHMIYTRNMLEFLGVHCIDFFKECYRILEPNGILQLELANSFHYRARLNFLFGRYILDGTYHPFHMKLLKPTYIRDLLRHIGFAVEFQKTTKLWHAIGLEQIFPDLFARGIVIKARKRR